MSGHDKESERKQTRTVRRCKKQNGVHADDGVWRHGTQDRETAVPPSWENGRSFGLPLPLCAFAIHNVQTTASTGVDHVVNGDVQFNVSKQMKSMQDGKPW